MSRRPQPVDSTESFGSDSFLDIVANMVGIMIILVMVVGLRIKNAAENPVVEAPAVPKIDLAPLEASARELEQDSRTLLSRAAELDALAQVRYDERAQLGLIVAAKEKQLEDQKNKLAEADRGTFDVRQALLVEAETLKSLEAEIQALVYAPSKEVIKIKTYPTPISRTVYGRETHFQLRRGRIVLVPLDQLVDELKHNIENKTFRANELDEITETVGPIGNFRMRYTLEKVAVPPQMKGNSITPGGMMIRTTQFTLLPVSDVLGETYADAMGRDSDFQRVLADLDPRRVTITLWAYSDSFDDYRRMREYLYERGFTVAGRPLPEGQPISGSPYGSKSAAQ
ncbi:MAG: hypothetical protein J0M17_27185 [Planctomycetes bacterium]|nr:hypothetical protein [Planctomycetota bacterium]